MNKKFLFAIIALLLVAFFIWKTQPTSTTTMLDNTAQIETDAPSPQPTVGISYLTILDNPEFRVKMQQAVKNEDRELALSLQAKALEIANAASLPQDQIDILQGDSGIQFMQFLASRQLFNQEFENFYMQLRPRDQLNDVFRRYPEAQDLFDHAAQLIEQRDKQIQQIADELNLEQGPDASLEAARQMWLDKANPQPLPEN